jgi:hypothetical protein
MVETELFAQTYKNYGLRPCGIRCWKPPRRWNRRERARVFVASVTGGRTAHKSLTTLRGYHNLTLMPTGGNEAEWLTRKKRIDTKLRSLNPQWQIVSWDEGLDTTRLACHGVTEFPTANGRADYVLFVNGVLLESSKPKT